MQAEEAAAGIVLAEPGQRTHDLIRLLQAGLVHPTSSRAQAAQQAVLAGASLDRAMSMLRASRGAEDAEVRLSRILQSLLDVKNSVEERSTEAGLVWTGHKPSGSALRATSPVIREMLDAAMSHVIVLSYSVWLGNERVGAVLDQLATARRHGVHVTFVIDRNYNPGGGIPDHNREQLRARWPKDAPRPDVYSWGDDDDRIAKLHAKVIIVDRRDLLVTSANLTGHGMDRNLELGARLVGRPVEQAHDHILDLIRDGTFIRENPGEPPVRWPTSLQY